MSVNNYPEFNANPPIHPIPGENYVKSINGKVGDVIIGLDGMIPDPPTEEGSYALKVDVDSRGRSNFSWKNNETLIIHTDDEETNSENFEFIVDNNG